MLNIENVILVGSAICFGVILIMDIQFCAEFIRYLFFLQITCCVVNKKEYRLEVSRRFPFMEEEFYKNNNLFCLCKNEQTQQGQLLFINSDSIVLTNQGKKKIVPFDIIKKIERI